MAVRVSPVTRRWLDKQTNEVQREIFALSRNPEKAVHTRGFLMAPVVAQIVYSETHWLIYYQSEGRTLIVNAGDINETPNIWRTTG
jgi:hypothetical protein